MPPDSHCGTDDDRFPKEHESARLPGWPGVFLNIEQEVTVMSKDHSRRAILAGIAAAPALTAPALALCGSDPIFAAIERHKATDVAAGLSF